MQPTSSTSNREQPRPQRVINVTGLNHFSVTIPWNVEREQQRERNLNFNRGRITPWTGPLS